MLKCSKLTIEGKMVLEAGVVFEGEAKVTARAGAWVEVRVRARVRVGVRVRCA